MLRLAAEREVVLLPGAGFDAPDWTVRVSLANLPDQDYVKIGKQIKSLIAEYYGEYQKAKK